MTAAPQHRPHGPLPAVITPTNSTTSSPQPVDLAPVLLHCPLWHLRAAHLASSGVPDMFWPDDNGRLRRGTPGRWDYEGDIVNCADILNDLGRDALILTSPTATIPHGRCTVDPDLLATWISTHRPALWLEVVLSETVLTGSHYTPDNTSPVGVWFALIGNGSLVERGLLRTAEQEEAFRRVAKQVVWAEPSRPVRDVAGNSEALLAALRHEGISERQALAADAAGISVSEIIHALRSGELVDPASLETLGALRDGTHLSLLPIPH